MQEIIITPDNLRALLAQKENLRVEFKLEYRFQGQNSERDRDEVAKDLIALANTAGRHDNDYAYLVIGAGDELLKDKTRVYKLVEPGQYTARQFLDIVNERCSPNLASIEYHEVELDGRLYGVVVIPPSRHVHELKRVLHAKNRGYWPRNAILQRVGEGAAQATARDILTMMREKDVWLTVNRILDPEDEDIFAIYQLEKREFKEVDPYLEMKDWVCEMQEAASAGSSELDEILLALKSDREVVGSLFAQHYIPQQSIFISYIVLDHRVMEAKRAGSVTLLRKLFSICDLATTPWNCIVGEVDETNAENLFYTFSIGANQLGGTPGGELFMLDIDYAEPAIKPSVLEKTHPSPKLRLLYFARDKERLICSDNNEYHLGPDDAKQLFEVIYRVYRDGYPDDIEYQQELRKVFDYYLERVKSGVRLLDSTSFKQSKRRRFGIGDV